VDIYSEEIETVEEREMIKSVIRCPNNMVIVFDYEDEQVPEYQGYYEEVRERVLRDAPPDALFGLWFDYETDVRTVSREEW
jgi:hypothetical protein